MDATVLSQLQITHYYQVADVILFICDYVQTFEAEVKYIWGSKWSFMKILFFVIRYTPFIDLPLKMMTVHLPSPSSKACFAIFIIENHITSLGLTFTQVFFCVRAYALWGPNRTSLLLFSFLAVLTGTIGFVVSILFDTATVGATNTGLPGCAEATAGGLIYAIIGATYAIVVDTILMGIILLARRRRFDGDGTLVVRRIYRDAIFYFGLELLVHLLAIILWVTVPDPLKEIPAILPRVTMCIITSRVILHIRKFGAEDEASLVPVSTLEFARAASEPPEHVQGQSL